MTEKTIVHTMELPYGQEWLWYPEANMIVLSPCLNEAGRERALCEAHAEWRRSHIRLVPQGVG